MMISAEVVETSVSVTKHRRFLYSFFLPHFARFCQSFWEFFFLTIIVIFFPFQALENELSNHQFRIDTVLASGQDLIDSNHYAADEIEERCEELNEGWELLMKAAAERKQRLSDALESQKVNKYALLYSWQRRWAR